MSSICTRLLLCLCVILLAQSSFSQLKCGFDELHKASLNDPVYKRKFDSSQKLLKEYIDRKSLVAQGPLATIYRIPVVVHVIHKGEPPGTATNISDAQVNSAISSLNQFFRNGFGTSVDVEIEFELAKIDQTCMTTSGINRINGTVIPDYGANGITIFGATPNVSAVKALSTWRNRDYYNIWVVSEIENNGGLNGIQGFATFPTSHVEDGTVILFNAFGYDPGGTLGYNLKPATRLNTTLAHEMGHALNLYHSFQGDDTTGDDVPDACPLNTSCTTQGDRVCDTDPHQRSPYNCPSGTNTCTGASIIPISHNFMDYSSSTCQDRFTAGQVTRMRSALELQRTSLLTSLALNVYPIIPYVQPAGACAATTAGGGGLTNDYAGIMNVGINGRNFSSSVPRVDNSSSGYVNWTADCHTLNRLVRGGIYTFSVTVIGFNDQQVRAWIDYNNNGAFDNSTEEIFVRTQIPDNYPIGFVTVSGNFTVPSNATVNTGLRLRVIDDLSSTYGGFSAIPNACYDPAYGQAEDFPVLISSTLPVTLESFTAKKQDEFVLLEWQTSLEESSKEFQVEKSTDGINFHKIGIVPASGRSTAIRNYSFLDRTITQEKNFYRLKQVDIDARFEYSKIVLVKSPIDNGVPFRLLTNPVQQNIDIQFGEVDNGKVQVRLADVTGKVLAIWNGEQVANSRVRINITDKSLSSGVYLLLAQINGKQYVQKVIIQ